MGFFAKTTVDSITKQLAKTVQQLEDLAAAEENEVAKKTEQIVALQEEVHNHSCECGRASKVAGNIRNLISGA